MEDLLRYNGADFAGFALTLCSIWALGNHKRIGWTLGMAASIAWAFFSWQAESLPTFTANFVFFGLNMRGYVKWRGIPGTDGGDPPTQ